MTQSGRRSTLYKWGVENRYKRIREARKFLSSEYSKME